jgi:hypothetical protein
MARGLAPGLPYARWHREIIRPLYQALTLDDVRAFTLLGALDALGGGATAVLNFQAFPNDVDACLAAAEAIAEAGLRGVHVKAAYGAQASPEMLTVDEAARLLRIGRTKAYAMTKEWRATNGRSGLPVIELGGVLRVPRRALDRLIDSAVSSVGASSPSAASPTVTAVAPEPRRSPRRPPQPRPPAPAHSPAAAPPPSGSRSVARRWPGPPGARIPWTATGTSPRQ